MTPIAIDAAVKTNTSTPMTAPTPLTSFDGVTVLGDGVAVFTEGVPGKGGIEHNET